MSSGKRFPFVVRDNPPLSAKPFLITGLPRSRTAWMAAYLTNGRVMCKHEPLKYLSDVSELPDAIYSEYHTHSGLSDSGAGYFLPWIMKNLDPPTVIIERDIEEVNHSMQVNGYVMGDALRLLRERLHAFKYHPRVLWVSYDSLNDKHTMEAIHFHLLPSVAFDEERFEQFKQFLINVDQSVVIDAYRKNTEGQNNMLKEGLSCG
jgi:hypothetical protein